MEGGGKKDKNGVYKVGSVRLLCPHGVKARELSVATKRGSNTIEYTECKWSVSVSFRAFSPSQASLVLGDAEGVWTITKLCCLHSGHPPDRSAGNVPLRFLKNDIDMKALHHQKARCVLSLNQRVSLRLIHVHCNLSHKALLTLECLS